MLIVALFFLFCGGCSDSNFQYRANSDLVTVHRDTSFQSESTGLGIFTLYGTGSVHDLFRARPLEKSVLVASNDIGITDLAIVFANITSEGLHMFAFENNSLLNGKYSVYVIAQQNITVNGVRMLSGTVQEWTAPFPQFLSISNGNITYIVRLRQVASLDDIPDTDRPSNATAEFNMFHLAGVTIGGSVASLASLMFWIVLLVFIKSQKVHEGLPNEL